MPNLNSAIEFITSSLKQTNISIEILCFGVVLLSYIATKIIIPNAGRLLNKFTRTNTEQYLEEHSFYQKSSTTLTLVTLTVLYRQFMFIESPWHQITSMALALASTIFVTRFLFCTLNVAESIYDNSPNSKQLPATGFIQAIKILIILMATIIAIAIAADKNPLYILSGIGAVAAVLIFAFKNIIEGFIGSIQVITNKIIAVGDWVDVDGKVDGIVTKISLNVVEIEKWDKTICTIPTHSIMNRTITNWKGMYESNCRRIKQSILIDQQSIRTVQTTNPTSAMNNLKLYRDSVEKMLKQHEGIDQTQTLLVRTLQPTAHGLPLEIYTFSKDNRWVQMERLQSELISEIIVLAKNFDLNIYQKESDYRVGRVN